MFNLAFYSYYFGHHVHNPPPPPCTKYDCYFFTNNREMFSKLQNTTWISVFIDRNDFQEGTNQSNMFGKHIKSCPEDYEELRKYDFLCLFDDKIATTNVMKVEEYIQKYCIEKNYAFLIKEHEFLKPCVYNEYNECVKQLRYAIESERYLRYIQKQVKSGLSILSDTHCQTGFIIRNMRHISINNIDHTWYSHIQECGIECQISFFFVKQLFSKDIYVFSTQECREVTQ